MKKSVFSVVYNWFENEIIKTKNASEKALLSHFKSISIKEKK
ncbi:hypothetical protein [Flavobacterium ustbae]|nr:hypothetical protein [Flavobacterium ustbae]